MMEFSLATKDLEMHFDKISKTKMKNDMLERSVRVLKDKCKNLIEV
jgi:hypothetical protein